MIDAPLKIALRGIVPVRRSRLLLFLAVGLGLSLFTSGFVLAGGSPATPDLKLLLAVVAELQDKLAIPDRIQVILVENNNRVISVSRNPLDGSEFTISCERSFLDSLSMDEIRAAFAHELGHVWIFTHHPYLQTEELANRIAGQVVSTEDLGDIQNKSAAYLAQRIQSMASEASSR